jgi:cytochrome c553
MATMALGRDGTEMRPVKKSPQSILSLSSDQVNDLVAYLRSWELLSSPMEIPHNFVIPWDLRNGKELYVSNCSGCHGLNGKAELVEPGLSAWAPALNNEGFLSAATDGFIQATVIRGRMGTAMQAFGQGSQGLVDLSKEDIDDMVAYIRRWSHQAVSPMTIPAEITSLVTTKKVSTAPTVTVEKIKEEN